MQRNHLTFLYTFLLSLCLPHRPWAQSPTGIIQAKVTDPTGMRIVGALVTVTPQTRNLARKKATTNDKGYFTIVQLLPNTYTLVITKDGYQTLRKVVVLDTAGRIDARPLKVIANPGTDTSLIVDTEGYAFVLVPLATPQRNDQLATLGSFAIQMGFPLSNAARSQAQTPQTPPPTRGAGGGAAAPQPIAQGPLVPAKEDRGRLQLQPLSGERSDLVTNNQVVNLALNGRDLLDFMKLLPGVVTNFNGEVSRTDQSTAFNVNGMRGNQNNVVVDGISILDTGDNGIRHITLNIDAVAELKVQMANYQAEYGTGAGGLANLVMKTKSGSDNFHGGGRLFHRHEGLNANSFTNNLLGRPRPLYRYNSFGYEIGGPVYLPLFGSGGKMVKKINHLYFYANQEFYRQFVPQPTPIFMRVPTAKERNGDFSETTAALRDPRSASLCPTGTEATCIRGNLIPRNRWFSGGQALLNLFPSPNITRGGDNYVSQLSHDAPRREDIVRLDYEPTDNTEIAARFINNDDLQKTNYGAFPIRTNFPLAPIHFARPGSNLSLSVTHAFSPSAINELIAGASGNRVFINNPEERLAASAYNLSFPLLFPQANRGALLPSLLFGNFGGSSTTPNIEFLGGPFASRNLVWNLADNFTKLWRDHTFKGGVFWQRARKHETVPGLPFFSNTRVAFGGGANSTGNSFADALLGEYASYEQATRAVSARYRFQTVEGYFQDLWRVNDRLVLDFGLRVSWLQPQYDENLQLASFNPALYDLKKAPQLKLQNGNVVLVPGTGDANNGFGLASAGYPRGGYDGRGAQYGPRFGFAYDITGSGSTILRGGFGVFYDRIEGNRLRDLLTNPPSVRVARLLNGNLNGIATLAGQTLNDPLSPINIAPPVAIGVAKDGKIPTAYSYSLNVQRDLGWETVVDVAYVGTLGRHLMQARNLNALPYGKLYTCEAQDPSRFNNQNPCALANGDPTIAPIFKDAGLKFDGTKALPLNLLRPFPGYDRIAFREFTGSSNYHSLQVSARRRLSTDLTFGVAYTWSKAFNTSNADQNINTVGGARAYDYQLASYDRQHRLAVNYIYNLPHLSGWFGGHAVAKAIFDGWKFSGISQFETGRPIELGSGATSITADSPGSASGFGALAAQLTGSYTDGPRVYLRYDPYERLSDNTAYLNPASIYLGQPGDFGPWPRQYWRTPNIQNHDLALFKEVALNDKGQYLQLRFEMFNAFNHAQFNNLNLGVTPTIDTANNDTLVIVRAREGDYYNYGKTTTTKFPAGCEAVANRPGVCLLKRKNTGVLGSFFGEPAGSRSGRVIQLGFKLNF